MLLHVLHAVLVGFLDVPRVRVLGLNPFLLKPIRSVCTSVLAQPVVFYKLTNTVPAISWWDIETVLGPGAFVRRKLWSLLLLLALQCQ